jgi:menaquinol-cytochrome c reductase iron-sulfur subunit
VCRDAEVEMQKKGVRFYCPCHGGEYDEFGVNIGGPPPRPLDIFETFIQDGDVYISVLSPKKREAKG